VRDMLFATRVYDMALKPASISITMHDDVTCIQLVGDIVVEEHVVDKIGAAASSVIENNTLPKLIISFKDVSYVASAVIGTMISISHRLTDKGTRLRICDVNAHIRGVCEVTRITDLFDFYQSFDDALASLADADDVSQ